jgi:hypothetical protein
MIDHAITNPLAISSRSNFMSKTVQTRENGCNNESSKLDNTRNLARVGGGEELPVTLQAVWRALENGGWASKRALRDASGLDDDTINQIINFLNRWEFVDIQHSPDFQVRRKPGTISPLETFQLLNEMTTAPVTPRRKLAERFACRACYGRNLNHVGPNEVECGRCHEKQWYAIEAQTPLIQPQQPHARLSSLNPTP